MTTEGLDALRESVASRIHAMRCQAEHITRCCGPTPSDYDFANVAITEVWSAACQQQRAADVEALKRQTAGRLLSPGSRVGWARATDYLASLPFADTP